MTEIKNYIRMIDIVSFLKGKNTFRRKRKLDKMIFNQNRTAHYDWKALQDIL